MMQKRSREGCMSASMTRVSDTKRFKAEAEVRYNQTYDVKLSDIGDAIVSIEAGTHIDLEEIDESDDATSISSFGLPGASDFNELPENLSSCGNDHHYPCEEANTFAMYDRIMDWIIVTKKEQAALTPDDSDNNICPDGSSPMTKQEFSEGMYNIFQAHDVTLEAQKKILQFCQRTFPAAAIPLHVSKRKNIVVDIEQYNKPSIRMLTVSICPAGCCAFFANLSKETRCPRCNAERFTQCVHPSCKGLSYDGCIVHQLSGRTPRKVMHYRPLLGLVIELLETSGFLECLSWSFNKPAGECISDLMEAANPKKHLAAMHLNYLRRCEIDRSRYVEVSLILSLFYDGAQIYKSKASCFWPLFCSILNLPPSFRNKINVGTFLIALFTGESGSNAETFLFEELFIGELLAFEAGQIINIAGMSYFVQIRIIQHCLDTKALGKMLFVQEVGSLAGCPLCTSYHGVTRTGLSRVVCGQHRKLLPLTSVLRIIGNSKSCCPPKYYEQNERLTLQDMNQVVKYKANHELKNVYKNILKNIGLPVKPQFPRSLIKSSKTWSCSLSAGALKEFVDNKFPPIWYHTPVCGDVDHPHQFNNLVPSLHYPHCDLRAQVQLTRRSKELFMEQGANAVETGQVSSGVKGIWPYHRISSVDVETDIAYDGFHALKGITLQTIKGLKGARLTEKICTYCSDNNVHPGLRIKKVEKDKSAPSDAKALPPSAANKQAPWIITPKNQFIIDAHVDSILVPKSYSDSFQIKNIFQQTGHLRGHDCIMTFTCLIRRINMLSDIDFGVKCFLDMLGSDLNELLAPQHYDANLDNLHMKICETAACMEGIFPDSESTFLWHEFVHLTNHIRQMGPLPGWWTYGGERALSWIKKMVPSGGQSMEITTMRRYNAKESAGTKASYNFTLGTINECENVCSSLFEGDTFIAQSKSKGFRIQHNSQRVELSKDKTESFKIQYSPFEVNKLLYAFVYEVIKQTESVKDALNRSSVYRLFHLFRFHSVERFFNLTFYDWFYCLATATDDSEGACALRKHIHNFLPIETNSVERLTENGYILNSDIECAMGFINWQKTGPVIYHSAIIYGQKFFARGEQFREFDSPNSNYQYGMEPDQIQYKVVNEANNITNRWKCADQISSWIKFRAPPKGFQTRTNIKGIYAQLNFCFYVDLVADGVLHGVPFGNIVQRQHLTNERVDFIDCSPWQSYCKNPHVFIALTDLYATPILIQPTAKNGKPIQTSKTDKLRTAENQAYFASKGSEVSNLYMLPLYPMNDCIQYDKNCNHLYNKP